MAVSRYAGERTPYFELAFVVKKSLQASASGAHWLVLVCPNILGR
jgi:hypothetical protein